MEETAEQVKHMADILEDSEDIRPDMLDRLEAIRQMAPYDAKRELIALYEDYRRFHGADLPTSGDLFQASEEFMPDMMVVEARKAGVTSYHAKEFSEMLTEKHHVFPQGKGKLRKWFENRGFIGADDIDNYCVKLTIDEHAVQHGGSDWRFARQEAKKAKARSVTPFEWNYLVMHTLENAELAKGSKLTVAEIKAIVFNLMQQRGIPQDLEPYK